MNKDKNLAKRLENKKLRHPVLDFFTPHELGGLGETIEDRYLQVNQIPDTIDIPIIKPKTSLNNKNEFNVAIVKS